MNSRLKIWTSFNVSKLPLTLVLALSLLVLTGVFSPSQSREHSAKATVDPAEDNLKQGLALIRQHNYEGATDSFKQAVYFSRNQYNPPAQKYLALCYKAQRIYPKAIETFQTYFNQVTEPDPESRIEMAECYMALQDWKSARHVMELAGPDSFNSPLTPRYRYAQGELNEKMADAGGLRNGEGNYGEAQNFYEEAIQEKKYYKDAWMAKARCQLKLGNTNDALRTYREILSEGAMLRPDHQDLEQLYYNMGRCLYSHGDHQGALDHYHLALEQNPDSFDAHLAIATLLDLERHYGSALKEYEAALRCSRDDDPNSEKIKRRIILIEQGLQPKEAPVEIKPSPSMRQQADEQSQPPTSTPPPGKDAGF